MRNLLAVFMVLVVAACTAAQTPIISGSMITDIYITGSHVGYLAGYSSGVVVGTTSGIAAVASSTASGVPAVTGSAAATADGVSFGKYTYGFIAGCIGQYAQDASADLLVYRAAQFTPTWSGYTGIVTNNDSTRGAMLAAAITTASAGDVIYLVAKNYDISDPSLTGSLQVFTSLTVVGAGPGLTTITMGTSANVLNSITLTPSISVAFQDLSFTGYSDSIFMFLLNAGNVSFNHCSLTISGAGEHSELFENGTNGLSLVNIYSSSITCLSSPYGMCHLATLTKKVNFSVCDSIINIGGSCTTTMYGLNFAQAGGNAYLYRDVFTFTGTAGSTAACVNGTNSGITCYSTSFNMLGSQTTSWDVITSSSGSATLYGCQATGGGPITSTSSGTVSGVNTKTYP